VGAEPVASGSPDPFRVIEERNIFSTKGSPKADLAIAAQPQRNKDTLALTGIMSYDRGQFAFFDGSQPAFQKVLKIGDSIGGCVLTRIAPRQVTLSVGNTKFELPMGTQLVRERGEPWKMAEYMVEDISSSENILIHKAQAPESTQQETFAKEEKKFDGDPKKYAKWVEKNWDKYDKQLEKAYPELKEARKLLKEFDKASGAAPIKKPKREKNE
jgi:hypothetical protein